MYLVEQRRRGKEEKGSTKGATKTAQSETKMPVQKYRVDLSQGERETLRILIQTRAPSDRRVQHAKILLESAMGKRAAQVATWVGVGHCTVERTRQR